VVVPGFYAVFLLTVVLSLAMRRGSLRVAANGCASIIGALFGFLGLGIGPLILLEALEPGEPRRLFPFVAAGMFFFGGALLMLGIVANQRWLRCLGWGSLVTVVAVPSTLTVLLPVLGPCAPVIRGDASDADDLDPNGTTVGRRRSLVR
jgi:hypothetical protein